MAKDKVENQEDNDESQEDNEENQENSGLSKKKLIIMAGIGLLVIGLGAGGAFFFMGSEESAEEDMMEEMVETDEVMEQMSIYHELHPAFVSNFSGKSKKKFMQVYIVALAREDSVIEDLKLHMPAVRNNVLMTLSETTSDEIETVEGKEELRQKVLTRIQETMQMKTGKDSIEDIYFTKFIAQ